MVSSGRPGMDVIFLPGVGYCGAVVEQVADAIAIGILIASTGVRDDDRLSRIPPEKVAGTLVITLQCANA
jgi:hypothetical protein